MKQNKIKNTEYSNQMNISSYNYLLNEPEEINEIQTVALEKVLDEYAILRAKR